MTPEREKEIRELNKTPGAFSHCVEDLLAEIDQQRKSLTIVRGLLETACEEMIWNGRQWQDAKQKLDLAVKTMKEVLEMTRGMTLRKPVYLKIDCALKEIEEKNESQ